MDNVRYNELMNKINGIKIGDEIIEGIIALTTTSGVSENKILGNKDIPNNAKGLNNIILGIVKNYNIDIDTDNTYDFQFFKLALDSLMFSVIVKIMETYLEDNCIITDEKFEKYTFNINTNIELLLETYIENNPMLEDIDIEYDYCEYTNVSDYLKEFESILFDSDSVESNKAIEESKENKVEKEEVETEKDNFSDDNKKVWDKFLDTPVRGILNVYQKLFSAGYSLFKPRGVISNGRLNITQVDMQIQQLWNLINMSITGSKDIFKDCNSLYPTKEDIKNNISYFPRFMLRCALGVSTEDDKNFNKNFPDGVKNWESLRKYLDIELKTLFRKILESDGITINDSIKATEKLKPIMEIMKHCFLVDEIDERGAFKIKLSLGDNGGKITQESIEKTLKAGKTIFDSSVYVDRCIEARGVDGVYYITIVHNEQAYKSVPLFAFQVLDAFKNSGIKPSWSNVILGRRNDDTVYTRNFEDNTSGCISIIAGSRSGKGVLTLNLGTNALGCGAPIFYLDCKPDMSFSLQDIVSVRGKDMFAFDGSSGIGGSSSATLINKDAMPIVPRHSFNNERYYDIDSIPSVLSEQLLYSEIDKVGFTNIISYLRGIELITKLIEMRAGRNFDTTGGERVVAIIDELEKYDIALSCLMKAMYDIVIEETAGMKPEERNENETYKYYRTFSKWAKVTLQKFGGMFTAQLGMSKTTLIFIFQNCKPLLKEYTSGVSYAKDGTIQLKNGYGFVFECLGSQIRTGSIRLLGNGTDGKADGNQGYGCGGAEVPYDIKSVVKNFGFVDTLERGKSAGLDSIEFRPYFVLNDTKGNCVEELYERCIKAGINKKELDAILTNTEDGVQLKDGIREDVAFLGYAKRLLETTEDNVIDLLASSWNIGEYIAKNQFGYSNLVSFMYDLHSFGFRKGIENIQETDETWGDIDVTEESESNDEKSNFYENNNEEDNNYNDELDNNELSNNLEILNEAHRNSIDSTKGVFNVCGEKLKPAVYNDELFKEDNRLFFKSIDFMTEESITESLKKLAILLYSHIDTCIGEGRVNSIVEYDRYLIVNNVVISPKVNEEIVGKLPWDVRSEVSSGRWASIFCFGFTRHYMELQEMKYSDTKFFCNKVARDYGLTRVTKDDILSTIKKIFKEHKSLTLVTIEGFEYKRDEILASGFSSIFSKNRKCEENLDNVEKSYKVENSLREQVPQRFMSGLTSFYRNPAIKVAGTIGVGALAIFALSNPIGLISVGYLGGKAVVSGAKTTARRTKSFFGGIKEAFKDAMKN